MKQILYILLVCYCSLYVYAERNDTIDIREKIISRTRTEGIPAPILERIFPQSPQSKALARYGEYPVSMTTGIPDITIPLYEIKLGDFSLPISLSYHASGIKADDVATTVGLGWSLNAGGMITRSVNGAPDLEASSTATFYDYTNVSDVMNNPGHYVTNQIFGTDKQPSSDIESDRYNFNFAGRSGVFYYSYRDQCYIPVNYDRMSIEAMPCTGNEVIDSQFRITDTKGYEYEFGQPELIGEQNDEGLVKTVGAWYLTKIHTPYGDITFEYRMSPRYYVGHVSEELTVGYFYRYNGYEDYGNEWGTRYFRSCVNTVFDTPVLSSISWNGGSIEFAYSDDRRDLWKTRLTDMSVLTPTREEVKKVTFDNYHFWGNRSDNYRMMLHGISSTTDGTYSFTYNETGYLPSYSTVEYYSTSMSSVAAATTDYWGYYNGKSARSQIPRECFRYVKNQFASFPGDGNENKYADRSPSETHSKLGIIRSITYPTGGKTEFEFEANTHMGHTAGGLRVCSITCCNVNGHVLTHKEYDYVHGYALHINPLHSMLYEGYFLVDLYPIAGSPDQRSDYVCRNTPIFPLTDAPAIFYTEVRETTLGGDFTIYRYTGEPEPGWLDNVTTLGNFPIREHAYTHDYGMIIPCLVEETVCNADSIVMRREQYEYETAVAKNFSAGVRAFPLIKWCFSTGGESNALTSAPYGSGSYMVNWQTVIIDSVTVHSRVCRPVRKTITDSNGVQTVENYTYDPGLNTNSPKAVRSTNSDGREHLTEYVYPFERNDAMAHAMMADFMYDVPIETKNYCDSTLIRATQKDYVAKGGFMYPERLSVSLLGNDYFEKYHITGYGTRGNITKVLSKGLDVDSIRWDTTELYPLTHIRNGRTIAQYMWKPLVGVTQITAENGFSTNYLYDTAGRLSGIIDSYGQHEAFSYNYRNSGSPESILANYVRSTMYHAPSLGNPAVSYQYYDDIGRPTHIRNKGISPNGVPVYTFSRYDGKGRISWQSLPASYQTDTIPDRLTPADVLATCYADSTAYSSMTYDALDRLTFTSTAGSEWRAAGKGIAKEYVTNGANDVKLYHAPLTNTSLAKDGYYNAATLFGEKATDEDGHFLITYTDKLGRKILERRNGNNDTYYVYNDLGQLRFVLTPEYQTDGHKAVNAYEYRYDDRGRLVKKILPQCEYVQYWYDKADRLTFMQDADLREEGLYRFMLYDGMGRLAVQGLCSDCQRGFNGAYRYPKVTLSSTDAGLLGTGYMLSCTGLLTEPVLEMVNYYDGYQFLSNGNVSPDFSGLTHTDGTDVTGLQTGTIQATSDGGSVATLMSYDAKGRVTKTSTSVPSSSGSHKEEVTTTYTFTGRHETVTATLSNGSQALFSATRQNTYNAHNDMLSSATITITSPAQAGTSWTNTYDDLGRLITTSRPQTVGNVGYGYNLHGWTTGISTGSFTEQLHYTDGQGTPCFNGNISSQLWSNNTYRNGSANIWRGYKFTYDSLDRMTDAIYGEGSALTNKQNRYNESILSYNANGAIKRLQRRGLKQNGDYGKIDNLNIELSGNRISRVTDDAAPVTYSGAIDFADSTSPGLEYTYDGNGNLTSDANKGITLIEYDDHNMPRRIQFANGNKIEYVYTAEGKKLRTIYYTASTEQKDSTEYLFGGMLTRENGVLNKYLFDGGYYSFDNNAPTCHYYNRDHLGNIREVISETGVIEQVTHYYPFGTPFSDNSVTNPALQSYKYNSKEFDATHKLFTYDYGARQYDPLLAVWHGVDPMCEKDYRIGTSVYCRNNPVKHFDHDGNFPDIIWDVANIIYDAGAAVVEHVRGNHTVAQGHWGDFIADAFAATIPMVPAGITKIEKIARGTTETGKVYQKLKTFTDKNTTLSHDKGSLTGTKKALEKVKEKLGLDKTESLPKQKGKFGSPYRGDSKKGYRLDPAHPNAKLGSGEEYPHINYWDYTKEKRHKGGISGAEPIKD